MRKFLLLLLLFASFSLLSFSVSKEFQQGMTYLGNGDSKNAEKSFKIAANKGDVIAYQALGLIYYDQGKTDLAKKYLQMGIDKGEPIAMYGLGIIYENDGNIDMARKYYQMAVDNGLEDANAGLERIGN